MLTELPKDPIILLSFINTKLRNDYQTLDDLCEDLTIAKEELILKLKGIEYEYDAGRNQFL